MTWSTADWNNAEMKKRIARVHKEMEEEKHFFVEDDILARGKDETTEN